LADLYRRIDLTEAYLRRSEVVLMNTEQVLVAAQERLDRTKLDQIASAE
jgi:hypothetical protein